MHRVRFSTAPLALLYVHRFGWAIRAEILETFTIAPPPERFIGGATFTAIVAYAIGPT
jgi:hypothetical protein